MDINQWMTVAFGVVTVGLLLYVVVRKPPASIGEAQAQLSEAVEAARAYVARLARAGQLAFLPDRIGAWWDRSGEVDVVAVSDADGALLLGECKWSVNPVGTDVLGDLQGKARLVDPDSRWPAISYMLFAKTGFTPAVVARAADESVRLVTPEILVTGEL